MSRTKRRDTTLSDSMKFTMPYKRQTAKKRNLQKLADPYIDIYQ